MVKVIVGQKGSGKTKELIEAISNAVKTESGSIVCIEKGNSLRYDVSYHVRLVDAKEYQIRTFDQLTGFVSGLHAGNFDITHIFIDNLYKLLHNDRAQAAEFCRWCESFGEKNHINFTLAISDDPGNIDEALRKYL
ncbi:MAG: hypothetical protein IKT99_02195 [Oscillospiraceae bacterium]|nr:hypothetical protein [Oscillospiraceae bacterium]